LAAYQSTSLTQIAVLVHSTWSRLGGPTQTYDDFKQVSGPHRAWILTPKLNLT